MKYFKKIKNLESIFSDVSGLPIKNSQIRFDEKDAKERFNAFTNIPFSYELVLGDDEIVFMIDSEFVSEDWDVPFNEYQLRQEELVWSNENIIVDNEFLSLGDYAPESEDMIQERMYRIIARTLSGNGHHSEFWDYEHFNLKGLQDDDSYFSSLYLNFMTFLKEKGVPLPPVLARMDSVTSLTHNGDTEQLERLLTKEIMKYSGKNKGWIRQLQFEKEKILAIAQENENMFRKDNSFCEKFPDASVVFVGGEKKFYKYRILVVENDLNRSFEFTNEVASVLEENGLHGNTELVREYNLDGCCQYSESGKIDLVLFDWRNPSYGEAMQFGVPATTFSSNNVVGLEGNDSQSKDSKIISKITFNPGEIYNEKGMQEFCEKNNIRSMWYQSITQRCLARGVDAPAHYIVEEPGFLEGNGLVALINKERNIPFVLI